MLNSNPSPSQGAGILATLPSARPIWRFGVFEVDTRRLELRRSGTVVKLREQSFRILIYLLEHPCDIVTREELRRVLWPSDTYVDFDHSLNTAVMKLREALGDSTGTPLYIETVPKRGYRFIAPVSQSEATRNETTTEILKAPSLIEATPATETTLLEAPAALRRRGISIALIGSLVGLVLLIAAGALLFKRAHANHAEQQAGLNSSSFQIVPVTTATGNAIFPAFSPDGREIAYIWDGEDRRRYDVYVQLPGAEKPLRLTYSKSGQIGPPAWSPNGSQIAFGRCDGVNDGVFVVPALGGDERKLTTAGCLFTLPNALAWVEGGNGMLMIDRCSPNGSFELVHFSLSTGEKKCLTDSHSLDGTSSGYDLALSPDGETVALTRVGTVCCNIYTIPVSGGTPYLLTTDTKTDCWTVNDLGCGGFMWTPDGKSVVFASRRSTLSSLWEVSANGGGVERETKYPAIGSFSKDGLRLVYSEERNGEPPAIWQAELASVGGPVVGSRKLISSQYPEMSAQPSQDGAQLVWMSVRTGTGQIWARSVSGKGELQLTHGDFGTGTPRWAPDGKWIAFDGGATDGSEQVFVIDAEGRNYHSISTGPSDNVVPSWSRDGKALYFASDRTGVWQVWSTRCNRSRYSNDARRRIRLVRIDGR